MNVSDNKMISLIYELRDSSEEGRVLETVEKDKPLTFLFGNGKLLSGFENNIKDLQIGDAFSFQLKPDDAYGQRREELIVDIPKSVFEVDGNIDENICRVGNQVPMMDKSGQRLNGLILDIFNSTVKMDFNHPMAGTTLFFKGEITGIREPSDAEMADVQAGSCSCCSGETDSCNEGSCGEGNCC